MIKLVLHATTTPRHAIKRDFNPSLSTLAKSLRTSTPPPNSGHEVPLHVHLVAVLIHELSVGCGHDLESFMHRFLGWKEGGAEVQGALLLAETTSRHQDNARLIQDLFVQWNR